MRMMWVGLAEWARMRKAGNESIRVADTAITVVATLLVVLRG